MVDSIVSKNHCPQLKIRGPAHDKRVPSLGHCLSVRSLSFKLVVGQERFIQSLRRLRMGKHGHVFVKRFRALLLGFPD